MCNGIDGLFILGTAIWVFLLVAMLVSEIGCYREELRRSRELHKIWDDKER